MNSNSARTATRYTLKHGGALLDNGERVMVLTGVSFETQRDEATMDRIVASLNAHDDLVAALREAREYVAATWGSLRGAIGDNNVVKPSLDRIDAALAKATAP